MDVRPFDAYIRCFKGATRALGTLADAEARQWRSLAHKALDARIRAAGWSRSDAYRWLVEQLGVQESQAHMGLMRPAECQRAVAICGQKRC